MIYIVIFQPFIYNLLQDKNVLYIHACLKIMIIGEAAISSTEFKKFKEYFILFVKRKLPQVSYSL